jgi:hypothetical protein
MQYFLKGHTLCHILFWFYHFAALTGGQRLTILIGITPPRQRPGYTLGPNLNYAQVSLSRHMGHRHKYYQHLLIAWVFAARTFPSFTAKA